MAKRKSSKRNPGMPVVLVNPSNPRKRRRRGKSKRRRNPTTKRRRRNPYSMRRRNPRSAKWGDAAMSTLLGALGGGVAWGMNWGVAYIPIKPVWQTVTFGGVSLVTSVLLSKFADERAGSGIAGGAAVALGGRIQALMAMKEAQAGTEQPANGGAGAVYGRRAVSGAGAIYQRVAGPWQKGGAGAVFPVRNLKEAGAIVGQRPVAATMSNVNMTPRQNVKVQDAGASRYVQGPIRLFGPRTWAYGAGAPRRMVSAHNIGRY